MSEIKQKIECSGVHVSAIYSYPLKSGGPRAHVTAKVFLEGISGDRRAMVVDLEGKAITSRDCPVLLEVSSYLDDDEIFLHCPGRQSIIFDLVKSLSSLVKVNIWGDQVIARAGFEDADAWFSSLLDRDVRFVIMTEDSRRVIAFAPEHSVSFADAAPLLLIGEASLSELNTRRVGAHPVPMQRFRPNIVISGSQPFDEDTWLRIRIGDVEFKALGSWERCAVVSLDPNSPLSKPDPDGLRALSGFRRKEDGKVYFGEGLAPLNVGRVSVGDQVVILERKPRPLFQVPYPKPVQLLDECILGKYSLKQSSSLQLICVDIHEEVSGFKTFSFKDAGGSGFNYRPGQFITISLHDAEHSKRCYTISSSPSRPDILCISVKRQGGPGSNWLHDNLEVGMKLVASQPSGNFHFMARPAKKVAFISAGSGITPMISMLRWISDCYYPVDVAFFYTAKTSVDIPYYDELLRIKKRMGERLRITFNVSSERMTTHTPNFVHGRLKQETLISRCSDIDERAVFTCGPQSFMRDLKQWLSERPGFNSKNFLEEAFGEGEAVAIGASVELFKIKLTRSGVELESTQASSILNLAKAVGVRVPSSCNSGLCGVCKCRVTEGDWGLTSACADPDRSVLTNEEKDNGFVLACTTFPKGSVSIDI